MGNLVEIDPPLRPTFSQDGTPSHEIDKTLNDILKKYVPDHYCISSTNELLEKIKHVTAAGLVASLDQTS